MMGAGTLFPVRHLAPEVFKSFATASLLCYMLHLSFRYITLCGMVGLVYWPSNPRAPSIYNVDRYPLI